VLLRKGPVIISSLSLSSRDALVDLLRKCFSEVGEYIFNEKTVHNVNRLGFQSTSSLGFGVRPTNRLSLGMRL
jgi:hypothetical protein